MKTSTWYVIRQRIAWIKVHERGAPVVEVCLYYGISRKTLYKWWGRYQEAGGDFHALCDRSWRPKKRPLSSAMLYPGQRVQMDVKSLPKLELKGRPEPCQVLPMFENITLSTHFPHCLEKFGLTRNRPAMKALLVSGV